MYTPSEVSETKTKYIYIYIYNLYTRFNNFAKGSSRMVYDNEETICKLWTCFGEFENYKRNDVVYYNNEFVLIHGNLSYQFSWFFCYGDLGFLWIFLCNFFNSAICVVKIERNRLAFKGFLVKVKMLVHKFIDLFKICI